MEGAYRQSTCTAGVSMQLWTPFTHFWQRSNYLFVKKGNMSRRGPVDLEALISDKGLGTGHLIWVHDPGESVNPYCWLWHLHVCRATVTMATGEDGQEVAVIGTKSIACGFVKYKSVISTCLWCYNSLLTDIYVTCVIFSCLSTSKSQYVRDQE